MNYKGHLLLSGFCAVCKDREQNAVTATKRVTFSGTGPRGMKFDHAVIDVCDTHFDEINKSPLESDEVVHSIESLLP